MPLFDQETEITVLPDGCALVSDDADLDEELADRWRKVRSSTAVLFSRMHPSG